MIYCVARPPLLQNPWPWPIEWVQLHSTQLFMFCIFLFLYLTFSTAIFYSSSSPRCLKVSQMVSRCQDDLVCFAWSFFGVSSKHDQTGPTGLADKGNLGRFRPASSSAFGMFSDLASTNTFYKISEMRVRQEIWVRSANDQLLLPLLNSESFN